MKKPKSDVSCFEFCLAFDTQAFMIYLIICFCRLFFQLKLQLELLLEDLQSLVLQVKLLHLGDLFERAEHTVWTMTGHRAEVGLTSQTREMQELCCCY